MNQHLAVISLSSNSLLWSSSLMMLGFFLSGLVLASILHFPFRLYLVDPVLQDAMHRHPILIIEEKMFLCLKVVKLVSLCEVHSLFVYESEVSLHWLFDLLQEDVNHLFFFLNIFSFFSHLIKKNCSHFNVLIINQSFLLFNFHQAHHLLVSQQL